MLSLDHLMQQMAVLHQRKTAATELFHQLTGAICILEEMIKTHYPHSAPEAVEGEAKNEQANEQAAEQIA